jgi:cytochrome c oxidase subunit II
MCGKGHFGMRGTVVVESQGEFNVWLASKKPQYAIANAPATPATPSKADSATNAGTAKAMH